MKTLSIKHILVPTDFSECADNALQTAIKLAKVHDAKITLLNIVEASYYQLNLDYNLTDLAVINDSVESSMKQLKAIADKIIEKHKVEVNFEAVPGIINNAIYRRSSQLEVDLIVMGTHGIRGIKEFILGSNTYGVVEIATCPVLVIPQQCHINKFENVLFPVRDIPNALEKYNFLRKIIRKNNTHLNVLGVGYANKPDNINPLIEQVNTLVFEVVDDEIASSVSFSVGRDNIADVVLEVAQNIKADLIVITSKIDNTVSEMFLGTFAQRIINHSPIPVLHIK